MKVDEKQASIDWFGLDFDEFTNRLEAAKQGKEEYDAVEAQMMLCERRECGHPPFKKDGTSHKGKDCEHPEAVDYGTGTSRLNSLYWDYGQLWSFFAAVGLMDE